MEGGDPVDTGVQPDKPAHAAPNPQQQAKGFLNKKKRRSAQWSRVWVELGDQLLFYSDKQGGSQKKIKILGSTIQDEEFPSWAHAFSITPLKSSRSYYFALENDEEKANWLEQICEKQFGSHERTANTHNSSACIIQ